MEKCPKCGSLKTRKSSYQPRSEHRRWFSSWFRCRDCGMRFLSTDQLLIQFWSMGSLAFLAIAGALVWALQSQPGAPLSAQPVGDSPPDQTTSAFAPVETSPRAADLDPATRQAAENRDPDAQYRLGLAILERHWDRGKPVALDEATHWIRQAAEQNHARAQFLLGKLYQKGRGVIQDDQEAAIWFRRAAEQGDSLAMSHLGKLMKAGRGFEKNLVEAYTWLNLASARGDQSSESDRDRLRHRLSPEQLAEAQNRSRALDQSLPRLSGNTHDPFLDD
ncbi:Sel1 repeat protein [Thiocystis violascens DSM 198]|uniref:Sel1 repeat protein n=2 Tax=Thiocystis violascens TaxID=73141 RepID=I3Y6G5_THIV6|nr:Sel1 repeat protein [Thiocystis violascens DSM 198]